MCEDVAMKRNGMLLKQKQLIKSRTLGDIRPIKSIIQEQSKEYESSNSWAITGDKTTPIDTPPKPKYPTFTPVGNSNT